MYHCVSINELFSIIDKTVEMTFLQKIIMRKPLVQYSDNLGFIPEELRTLSYCFQLANNQIYAKASNTFKQ